MMLLIFKSFFVVWLIVVQLSLSEIVNKNVTRTIDLSADSVVRIVSTVKISGVQKNYVISYPIYLGDLLAFHAVYHKGKSCKCTSPVIVGNMTLITASLSVSVSSSAESGSSASSISSRSSTISSTIKIVAVFTEAVVPFPTGIRQNQAQYVRYSDHLYFFSPYATVVQKTIVTLPSVSTGANGGSSAASLLSYTTDGAEPYSLKKNVLVYGSYRSVDAFEQGLPLELHYRNDNAFLRLRLLQEVDIEKRRWWRPWSTWASDIDCAHRTGEFDDDGFVLSVEERVQIEHHGAKLVGGFSRYLHQHQLSDRMRQLPLSLSLSEPHAPVVTQLTTRLPAAAAHIRYRDEIGNISTSTVRRISHGHSDSDSDGDGDGSGADLVELELKPRYPLLGGWRAEFYIGYELPVDCEALSQLDRQQLMKTPDGQSTERSHRYELRWELFTGWQWQTPQISSASVEPYAESAELKLVLPASAAEIQVELPAACAGLLVGAIEQSWVERPTVLLSGSGGSPRPVVILRAHNLVAEHGAALRKSRGCNESVVVTFELSESNGATAAVSAAVMVVVVVVAVCWFVVSADMRPVLRWLLQSQSPSRSRPGRSIVVTNRELDSSGCRSAVAMISESEAVTSTTSDNCCPPSASSSASSSTSSSTSSAGLPEGDQHPPSILIHGHKAATLTSTANQAPCAGGGNASSFDILDSEASYPSRQQEQQQPNFPRKRVHFNLSGNNINSKKTSKSRQKL